MKKTTRIKTTVVAAIMPLLLSSCATIVSGGSPTIIIDGNVKYQSVFRLSPEIAYNILFMAITNWFMKLKQ